MQEKNQADVKKILNALGNHLKTKGIRGVAKHYGVKDSLLYGWIKRGRITDTGIILGKTPNINQEWLRTGHGPMLIESAKVVASPDEKEGGRGGINLREGHLMLDLVLMSQTHYAEALWSNLVSFAEGVRKEVRVKELEQKVDELKKMMQTVLENQAKQAQDQGQEKRDPAANA